MVIIGIEAMLDMQCLTCISVLAAPALNTGLCRLDFAVSWRSLTLAGTQDLNQYSFLSL